MKWPWSKSEHRAQDYTSLLVDAALGAASGRGTVGDAARVAAVTFGVGLLSRGFSTAMVSPMIPALDPEMLSRFARGLLLSGNAVFNIYADPMDGLMLQPVAYWDMTGSPRPSSWRYRLDIPGPSGRTMTRNVGAEGVIHVRLNPSLSQPWLGVSPLAEAGLSSELLANLEKRMGEESNQRVGALLPIPEGMADEPMAQLRADLATLRGGVKIVETTSGGHGQGRANAPQRDWMPSRLGADFPQYNVELRKQASMDVLAALGVPSALLSGEGAASREAWRHVIVTALAPLAKLVEHELAVKLEMPITITFPGLVQTDIAARARAYNSLVSAGMDPEKAEALAGLAT